MPTAARIRTLHLSDRPCPPESPTTSPKKEILEGIRLFEVNHPHTLSDSTTYDLLVDGKRYPPKATLGWR